MGKGKGKERLGVGGAHTLFAAISNPHAENEGAK